MLAKPEKILEFSVPELGTYVNAESEPDAAVESTFNDCVEPDPDVNVRYCAVPAFDDPILIEPAVTPAPDVDPTEPVAVMLPSTTKPPDAV